MADDITEAEQPEQGQDGGGQDVPYRDYLERIPEQYRGEVQPVLDDWNKHINGRLEENAGYRKQWEPYEQLGVGQVDPQELGGWLQFRQAAIENPQAIQQWYESYAQANGLTPQQAQELEAQQQEQGFVDPDLETLLEQKLGPLGQTLQELQQWREQQEQQVAVQAAHQFIDQQISTLKEKHGEEFDQQRVEPFIGNFIESDPEHAVERAFEAYREFRNSLEKQLMDSKLSQPSPAEAGGGTAVSQPERVSLADAKIQAQEQLRAMLRG